MPEAELTSFTVITVYGEYR